MSDYFHRCLCWSAAAALLALIFFAPPSASAGSPEWKNLLKRFEDTWRESQEAKSAERHRPVNPPEPENKIDPNKPEKPQPPKPGPWEGSRERQRAGVETLVKAQDARAVAVLLDAHSKQLEFIQDIQRKHDRRLLRWKSLQTFMELTQANRKKDEANKEEGAEVSKDEDLWNKEQLTLPGMWASILRERELTEYLRTSIAAVAAGLEKPERGRAHALLLKTLKATWKTCRKTKEEAPHRPVFPPKTKPKPKKPGDPEQDKRPVKPKRLPKYEPDIWEENRAKQRAAADTLARAGAGDGVGALLALHKKQLKFIAGIHKDYEEQHAKWTKLQPSMERALAGRPVTNGVMLVSKSEDKWINDQFMLAGMWANVMRETELAEDVRKSIAQVVGSLEGKQLNRALSPIFKAAGNGDKPGQLEFVRLLGYVAGDEVTTVLEKLASSMQPFVVQAALEALGRQNAARSVDTLLGRLDDPRWQVRASALKGLSFYRNERVVDALLERVAAEDGVMQRHYFSALNRMVGTAVTGQPVAWKKWWTENKAKVLAAWAEGAQAGPVLGDPPAIVVRSEAGGHTSFYGLKTDSKHIIFVLDISGSMGEHSGKDTNGKYRIDVAKVELKNAIRSLTSEESDERGVSSFNIVAYAGGVQVFKKGKMIPATKRNKEKAFKWIDELEAVGPTNIYDAMEQAFQIIGTRKAAKQLEKGADTIFLMTDGQPNRGRITDPDLIRKAIEKMNRDRRITINTIGIGADHAEEFLQALATENHGEYLGRGKPAKEKDEDAKPAK